MSTHPPESRLLDLATGLLLADDAKAIRDHVRACPECEARLCMIIADREAVRAGGVPIFNEGRIEFGRPVRARRMWVRVGLVAAVLVVVAMGVFRFIKPDAPPDYWIPMTSETTVMLRNGGDSLRTMTHLGAYQSHNAAAAVEELQALTPEPGNVTASTLRDIYLASALVNAGRPEEALNLLNSLKLHEPLPTQWRVHAEWVQYLALERAGKHHEAIAWLKRLAAEEPGELGQRARDGLHRIQ